MASSDPRRAHPGHDLLRRSAATQATLDKYRGTAWSWDAGRTCVHLARFHLRAMGHKPERIPQVSSALSARRALKARGWAGVVDLLDAQPGLLRIAPAMMLMGDVASAPSPDGIGGILICAGPHKFFGWRDDVEGMVVLDIRADQLTAAWRA